MEFFVKILAYLFLLFCCVKAATTHPNTVELALTSNFGNTIGIMYGVNLTIGTPGQPQTVLLDTGSSDTIFVASNASICERAGCDGGTFDSSKSTTFRMAKSGALDMSYADYTKMRGDLITDVVHFDDRAITNLPMGLAKEGSLPFAPRVGVLGLGYSSRMAHLTRRKGVKCFPGLVDTLVHAGAISSRLYSIYLNTLDLYGSILFGGIDTDKYKGPLTTLNLFKFGHPHRIDNFWLKLEKVTMQPNNGPNQTIFQATENINWHTLLDTGTPDWMLPTSAYHKLIGYAGVLPEGGHYSQSDILPNSFVKPCSEVSRGVDNTTRLELTFAGNGTNTATLQLELADLFTPLLDRNGSAVTNNNGQQVCWLRVLDLGSESMGPLISSGVMRAGYWVFDLDNGQVSVAQANLRANSSNVVQVEAGAEGLSKAADNVRAESQKVRVKGQKSASAVPRLSTLASTAGYTTHTGSQTTVTGIARPQKTSSGFGSSAPMRRSENAAAAMMLPGTVGLWYLGAFFIVLSTTILL